MFKAVTGSTGVIGTAAIAARMSRHTGAQPRKRAALCPREAAHDLVHALTDAEGRPRAYSSWQHSNVMMAPELLDAAGPLKRLIADKASIPTGARLTEGTPYQSITSIRKNREVGKPEAHPRTSPRCDPHKLARNFCNRTGATITWWT